MERLKTVAFEALRSSSTKAPSLRERFASIVDEISELRLTLEDYKLQKTAGQVFQTMQSSATPHEILTDLEEAKAWCEGVLKQLNRSIGETKDLLCLLEKT